MAKTRTFAALRGITRVLAVVPMFGVAVSAQAQNFSAEELQNRQIHRRAVEAVIWGMRRSTST